MNISFDIDNALLGSEQVQALAKLLSHIRRNLDRGYMLLSVSVITDRDRDEWEYSMSMKVMLDEFGLSVKDVHFTDGRPKVELVQELGIDVHLDSDPEAIAQINRKFPGKGWLVNYAG